MSDSGGGTKNLLKSNDGDSASNGHLLQGCPIYMLQHKSFAIVSEKLVHDSSTVITFIHKLVTAILPLFPTGLKYVNYWNDTNTSQ